MSQVNQLIKISLLLVTVFSICACTLATDPSGRMSFDTATIPEAQSRIVKGKTTQKELIRWLGSPSASSVDSSGNGGLSFSEKARISETGIWSVLNARSKIRILNVTLANGKIADYSTMEYWAKD